MKLLKLHSFINNRYKILDLILNQGLQSIVNKVDISVFLKFIRCYEKLILNYYFTKTNKGY